MTAEEYLKNSFNKIGDILRARILVNLARQEEREKSIKAFVELSSICTTCTDKCSVKCGEDCLMEKFIKLLYK